MILVTIRKIQSFFDVTNKKSICKIKEESEGKIIDEVVGLKLKMYSIKNIYGKESNTAKGDNIATNFNELKDTLFNKKILRHKMRRIQGKNINLEHMKSTKYHYHVLMKKDLF